MVNDNTLLLVFFDMIITVITRFKKKEIVMQLNNRVDDLLNNIYLVKTVPTLTKFVNFNRN